MRLPRKNDAKSIRARQEALAIDGLVTSIDLEPFAGAAEAVTGVAVIPVSVVPLTIELGTYELDDDGAVRETDRAVETVHVPLAHTEGGLTVSMTRGAKAAGTIATHVLQDRITRASCFVCASAAEAIVLARWIEGELEGLRVWLAGSDDPFLSRHAKLRGVTTHVVGPMCHVLWAWTTGDAVGPNMMTRNSYALNMGYVMDRAPVKPQRAILEANMGGDKKPSHQYFHSGHGKTVLAETTLARRDDRTRPAHEPRGSGGAVLGRDARCGRVRHAVGCLHARVGGRRDLRGDGPGSRDGRDELDGARHRPARRRRLPLLDPLRGPGGRYGRRRDDASFRARLARRDRLLRPGQGVPLRADRRGCRTCPGDIGLGRDGDGRFGELLPRASRARRRSLSTR